MGNFDELFNKTRIVAESLNKRGAKAIDLSRKRIEFLDVKTKLAKFYEKYGRLQFELSVGGEIDEAELDMLTAQIIAHREKFEALKAELDEGSNVNTDDLKREAEELKKEVISASQEAGRVIKKQMDEVKRKAEIAFKAAQAPKAEEIIVDEAPAEEAEAQNETADEQE